MQNPAQLVGTFITNLTDLLVVPDTQIRDTARDALGAELSPRLFPKLLKHLDECVLPLGSTFFQRIDLLIIRTIKSIEEGAGSELTDAYVLFYDQVCGSYHLLVDAISREAFTHFVSSSSL